MARILLNDNWYEELSTLFYYESEFEQLLLKHADMVFPDYHLVPFKTLVCDDHNSEKPDLALIHKGYQEWWVVEVEVEEKSIDKDILPRVRTLSYASYTKDHAEHICSKNPILSFDKVDSLLKETPPRILVVTNTPRINWATKLKEYDAILGILEVFRSLDKEDYLFRINGKQPSFDGELISECSFHPTLSRFLLVQPSSTLQIEPNEKIIIRYDGTITEWKRENIDDGIWLSPISSKIPLPQNEQFELRRGTDGLLVIRSKTRFAHNKSNIPSGIDTSYQRTLILKLKEALNERFNENELKDLCLHLDVKYEDLEGTVISAKVRELIDYFCRRNQLEIFQEVGPRVRNDIDWFSIFNN